MRAVLFTYFLIIAGLSIMDIAVAQGSLDLLDKDAIKKALIQYIKDMGWKQFELDVALDSDILIGKVRGLKIKGISGVYVNEVKYTSLMRRVDIDMTLRKVEVIVDQFEGEGRYGDIRGEGELSSSLVISNLRVVLNTILSLVPGAPVLIQDINTTDALGNIEVEIGKLLGEAIRRTINKWW